MQLKSVKLFTEFWKVADESYKDLDELFFLPKRRKEKNSSE
jgi:hypothetical protein